MLLIKKSNNSNFVDENTLLSGGNNLPVIQSNLQHDVKIVSDSFNMKSLKANSRKIKFIILGKAIRTALSIKPE